MEIEAYDNIGLQYYYLGNMNKASYYHNRMMNGLIERKTPEKLYWIKLILKGRSEKAYKQAASYATYFDCYKKSKGRLRELFIFPHENEREFEKYASVC